MQTLKIDFPINKNKIPVGPVVLALGFFDGVHIGHQRLIKKAREVADERKLPLMVMTFSKHPRVYFAGQKDFEYLTSVEMKAEIMASLGVDYLSVFDFEQGVGNLSPQEFVDQIVLALNAEVVVAGFDYTYGDPRIANMKELPKYAKDRFEIVEIPEQILDHQKIGSSAIRDYLDAGQIEEANKLLGYTFQISGKVIPGKQRGRQLGFRTANLAYPTHQKLPKIGVYATKLKVHGQWYEAMTSVGYNVTFEHERKIFVETNIFDFNDDIYGEEITVAWYKFLRGEVKFNGVNELITQLQLDEKETRAYFTGR